MLGRNVEGEFSKGGYLDQIGQFDPGFFQISAEECKYIDPQQRLLLELVEEAVQNSGIKSKDLWGKSVGVFMADSKNTYGQYLDKGIPLGLVNSLDSALAGRIAYTFIFAGPAMTFDTACSSSMVAIHYGCQALRLNECEIVVTGGASVNVAPLNKEEKSTLAVASWEEKVRAFDQYGDGTVSGEGGAVLVLKRLFKAIADGDPIHAIIKGSAVNSDGRRSNGLSAPNQYAQAEVIQRAIENAGVAPETISYVETHGTGTRLGDPIEVEGLQIAFSNYGLRKQSIPIGSLKTNIGHLNSAAGVASVVKVVLAMQNQQIPASLNFHEPNQEIDFIHSSVYVNNALNDWNVKGVKRAGVTSLGLIGTNIHMVLEEAPKFKKNDESRGRKLFTLSAKNRCSLRRMIDQLVEYLQKGNPLKNVAYTLNTGREHFLERIAIHGVNRQELLQELTICKERVVQNSKEKFSPVLIFADLDLTSDCKLNLDELEQNEPTFKHYYEEAIQCADGEINLQVQHFAYQYAYAKLLQSWGIVPDGTLGIGIGKIVSDIMQKKLVLEAGMKMAIEYNKGYQLVSKARLKSVLETMMKNGHKLFVTIGDVEQLGKMVENLLIEHDVLCMSLGFLQSELYDGICQLYMQGFDLDWYAFHADKNCRRIFVPSYSFDRKSYLLKRGN